MERYICIHGHFYQPPRENPWLEAVEVQDSAYPYHDWNERITAECYAPNSASRILDAGGEITRIVNNYAQISFNFGPTLLLWLEEKAPQVYRAILAADEQSRQNFSGHGAALAQAYNHMILPLANRRDKFTQVLWGIRDFEHRFGRKPEGMWLPETAVDLETLDILAEQGIQFTVLAPHQARRVRPLGGRAWRDVSGGRVDPSTAYRLRLQSGRLLSLFFYDGPISRAVAFEGLLERGEYLAGRLMGAFSEERDQPQVVHIATDGETYGHHKRHGDMALAYALHHIEQNQMARLTNYGEFLERHPPAMEAQIVEDSSWSCVHGIERWRDHCGCNSGGQPAWRQDWRKPLREAVDWLRDALVVRFEELGVGLFKNPWVARNHYIDVILDRSPENVEAFLRHHANHDLSAQEKITALKLLELQRQAMLMYTSCGWFFDELSGIETVQVLQYAGRALQLSEDLSSNGLEEPFLERLEQAKSNIAEHRDGRHVYEKFVKPAMVSLEKVGAHYAVSSLFETYGPETRTYCYAVHRDDYQLLTAGKSRLAFGRATITSEITGESAPVSFGVLHLGDHTVSGGIRGFRGQENYDALVQEIAETFRKGDFPEVIRLVDRNFEPGTYTLKLLFRDEQRKILNSILASTLAEAEAAYRQLYENHALLMRFVTLLGMPLPRHVQTAAEFTLNADLRRALEAQSLPVDRIQALLDETRRVGAHLDEATLEFALRQKIERLAGEFHEHPTELSFLEPLEAAVRLARMLPFEVEFWTAQNVFYEILQSLYPETRAKSEAGEASAQAWAERFRQLGEQLLVKVDL